MSYRGDREMHDATCGDCGKQCQVPFEPRQDKPVYCNECFSKHKPAPRGGSGGGDLSEEVEALAEDLVEEAALEEEAALTEDHEKCTRLHVEIVAKIVKYHSSQNKTNQYTAMIVFKIINQQEIRKRLYYDSKFY